MSEIPDLGLVLINGIGAIFLTSYALTWCSREKMPTPYMLIVSVGTMGVTMLSAFRGAPVLFPSLLGAAWMIISYRVIASWVGRSTKNPTPELSGGLAAIGWAMLGHLILNPVPANFLDLAWTFTSVVLLVSCVWVWKYWLKDKFKNRKKHVKYNYK